MSDSKMGARKKLNIRDNICVLNGILNNVMNNKQENMDVQIQDISQCFDAMWYKKTMTDLFEAETQNDHYSWLCELNKNL